ncbi:MAG: hypothetical protein IT360_16040 [Gemmatimonadaceae bacterium]|nr:hypothetical protein [Gemmatimonadaceae bacterium]
MRVVIEVPENVRASDVLTVRAIISNPTNDALLIGVPGPPPLVNVEVRSRSGALVWSRVTANAILGQSQYVWRVGPGEEYRAVVEWDLVSDAGIRARVGDYSVAASIEVDGRLVQSSSVPFTIVP